MSNSNKEEHNVIADFLRECRKDEANSLSLIQQVFNDDGIVDEGKTKSFSVALQNRHLQPEPPDPPIRLESPKRCHVFHDGRGYVDYLQKYASKNAVVFADVNNCVVSTVLDEKAEAGFEIVLLIPKIHTVIKPLCDLINHKIEISEFVTLLMSIRSIITEPSFMELTAILSQIRASTSVTLYAGSGKHDIKNGLVTTTMIDGERKDEFVEIPETFTVDTPVYVGTDKRKIIFDLILSVSSDTILVSLFSADLTIIMIELFEEFIEPLREIDGCVVSLGQPEHKLWSYQYFPEN